jgi:hypothetical protein
LEEQRVGFFVLAVIFGGRARGLRIVFSHTRTFLLAGAASTVAFATIFAARKRESAAQLKFLCAAADCGLKINLSILVAAYGRRFGAARLRFGRRFAFVRRLAFAQPF